MTYRSTEASDLIVMCLYKYFPYGGMQRDFMRIALRCAEQGYRIRVYAISWQGAEPEALDVVLVPSSGVMTFQRQRNFHAAVSRAVQALAPACVVGFNKMPSLDIYYAADACYLEKAKRHRSWFYRLSPRFRHYARFEKAVFDASGHTQILMLSAKQQRVFQFHYATPDDRFHALPPGISKDRAADEHALVTRERERRALGLGDQDHLTLMIGSGFSTKGLDRAIRAVASLPHDQARHVHLLAIGQDRPARYQRLARRLGLGERFRIIPGTDRIPEFLQAGDLLIHPAYIENTGTVIVEAIVAGLPVLTTDVCGYAHYVDEANCGIVVPSPFRQEQLDRALAGMLDANRRAQWRANGIQFGRTQDLYSLPQRAAQIICDFAQAGRS